MDSDEREICVYLKSWPGQFIAGREIARRAGGKRRFHDDPNWAVPVLSHLVEKGILEEDSGGHFRLIRREKKKGNDKKWMSPQIRKILEQSEKPFEIPDPDEPEEF